MVLLPNVKGSLSDVLVAGYWYGSTFSGAVCGARVRVPVSRTGPNDPRATSSSRAGARSSGALRRRRGARHGASEPHGGAAQGGAAVQLAVDHALRTRRAEHGQEQEFFAAGVSEGSGKGCG